MKIIKFFREMERARIYLLFIIFVLFMVLCSILLIQDRQTLIKFDAVLILLLTVLVYGIYVQYSSWKTMQDIGDKLVELRRLRRKNNGKNE